jgi:hypothetical protein
VAAVFDDLHHDLRWSEGELRVHGPGISGAVWPLAAKEEVPDGRCLVLSPTVLGWPNRCVATKPVTAGLVATRRDSRAVLHLRARAPEKRSHKAVSQSGRNERHSARVE